MAAELGDRFSLDLALTQGLVPLIWDADRPAEAPGRRLHQPY
jgi:hypothetical protein